MLDLSIVNCRLSDLAHSWIPICSKQLEHQSAWPHKHLYRTHIHATLASCSNIIISSLKCLAIDGFSRPDPVLATSVLHFDMISIKRFWDIKVSFRIAERTGSGFVLVRSDLQKQPLFQVSTRKETDAGITHSTTPSIAFLWSPCKPCRSSSIR